MVPLREKVFERERDPRSQMVSLIKPPHLSSPSNRPSLRQGCVRHKLRVGAVVNSVVAIVLGRAGNNAGSENDFVSCPLKKIVVSSWDEKPK